MKTPDKNALEWSVFGVALLLVLATLGYLVREALTQDGGPAEVVVLLGEPRSGAGGFMVPVRAENRGGRTAEDLRVAVQLQSAGMSEEAVLHIPFLPRESHREGWVTFRGDPGTGALRVVGVAYQDP